MSQDDRSYGLFMFFSMVTQCYTDDAEVVPQVSHARGERPKAADIGTAFRSGRSRMQRRSAFPRSASLENPLILLEF